MEAVRVQISSWTASFRYGGFMIGFQPTLPMPPLSTVYGIISAAAGRAVTPDDTFVAYCFGSQGRFTDLEKILEVVPGSGGKTNVIRREQIAHPRMTLYVSKEFEDCFRRPQFPLLLGRSSDLAAVDSVRPVGLRRVNGSQQRRFGHSIYSNPPQGYERVSMYALPVYFTDTMPRVPVGVRRFFMVDEEYEAEGEGYIDSSVSEEDQIVMEVFSKKSLGL